MKPQVTFVMPAFNASPFIEEAIDSIRNQSVADWQLIIVDDGSTDDTLAIAEKFAAVDPRIRVITSETPSGSAFIPRKRAILEADSEFVAPLDADDAIEPLYLEKLLDRRHGEDADIVYPAMHLYSGSRSGLFAPRDPAIYEGFRKGKDFVKLTLDGWRINCNGGIIRKSLYLEAFEKFQMLEGSVNADEMLGRQLLLLAPRVAFSDAKYLYRTNENSITRKPSVRIFHFIKNNVALIGFTAQFYGEDSEEYLLAQKQNFHGIFDGLRLLNRFRFDGPQRAMAMDIIREAKRNVREDMVRPVVSPRYFALLKTGLVPARLFLKLFDRQK